MADSPTESAPILSEPSLTGGFSPCRRYVQVDPRDTEHVKQFEAALESWNDHRFVSAQDIRTMTMFNMYLVNLADHADWVYRGHSWKESDYLGCLVVKGVVAGVPSVVFTNSANIVSGMHIFLRKLEADFLEWVPDKYA